MFALVLPSLARSCIAMKFGIAIAARMPMITTTIISSISVKPFCDLVMGFELLLSTWCQRRPAPADPTSPREGNRCAMETLTAASRCVTSICAAAGDVLFHGEQPENRAFPMASGANAGVVHETWPPHAQRTTLRSDFSIFAFRHA